MRTALALAVDPEQKPSRAFSCDKNGRHRDKLYTARGFVLVNLLEVLLKGFHVKTFPSCLVSVLKLMNSFVPRTI